MLACLRNAFSNMLLQVKGQSGYVLIGLEGSVEINVGQLGSIKSIRSIRSIRSKLGSTAIMLYKSKAS